MTAEGVGLGCNWLPWQGFVPKLGSQDKLRRLKGYATLFMEGTQLCSQHCDPFFCNQHKFSRGWPMYQSQLSWQLPSFLPLGWIKQLWASLIFYNREESPFCTADIAAETSISWQQSHLPGMLIVTLPSLFTLGNASILSGLWLLHRLSPVRLR